MSALRKQLDSCRNTLSTNAPLLEQFPEIEDLRDRIAGPR